MNHDDARQLRRRQSDLRSALDRAAGPERPASRGTYRGRVYSGGAIPTVVPRVFLTRPLTTAVDEVAGVAPTLTPDATASVPVLVLGPRVPVAGDDLTAHLEQGYWIAQTGQAAPPPVVTCDPAVFPAVDLELTYKYWALDVYPNANPFVTDRYTVRCLRKETTVPLVYQAPATPEGLPRWTSPFVFLADYGFYQYRDAMLDRYVLFCALTSTSSSLYRGIHEWELACSGTHWNLTHYLWTWRPLANGSFRAATGLPLIEGTYSADPLYAEFINDDSGFTCPTRAFTTLNELRAAMCNLPWTIAEIVTEPA